MSVRIPCTCGRKKSDHSDLVVVKYKCNFSAFNGYHYTPSDYSEVRCIRPSCNGTWRTKGKYIDDLPKEIAND